MENNSGYHLRVSEGHSRFHKEKKIKIGLMRMIKRSAASLTQNALHDWPLRMIPDPHSKSLDMKTSREIVKPCSERSRTNGGSKKRANSNGMQTLATLIRNFLCRYKTALRSSKYINWNAPGRGLYNHPNGRTQERTLLHATEPGIHCCRRFLEKCPISSPPPPHPNPG